MSDDVSAWDALASAVTADPEVAIAELRKSNVRLQSQLAKASDRTETLRSALYEAAKDALLANGPMRPTPAPKRDGRRKARAEVALLHLTDWQGSKVTPSYNSQIMRERVERVWAKTAEITDIQRAHHPVRKLVILLGGDMIEGLFNYPAQLAQIDATLFQQWATVSALLVDTVRWALSFFDEVEVVAEWGNHGRIGSKRDHVPKADNFDRMVYEHARQLLAHERRLLWRDCPEDIQRVEIGAYKALLIHGDEVGRNGFASPATIVRHADRWRSGAFRVDGEPWAFRDVYLGHYHTHQEFAMANGEGAIYMTGSTESDNRYAMDTMAASASPSQRLHFIDPEKGRVAAQYKVHLAN